MDTATERRIEKVGPLELDQSSIVAMAVRVEGLLSTFADGG